MTRKKHFVSAVIEKGITWILVFIFCVSQVHFVPRAEAAEPGTSTVSAGTAPSPAATTIDSFQPDLFTGRAAHSIPISVPPGRKGMQPSLQLQYSSGAQNGWVGVGWNMDVGYVGRSTRNGVPSYDTNDTFSLLFQSVNADLVQVGDGTYRAKDENAFLRVEDLGATGWEVRDKSGTRYLFGQTASSRIANGADVYRWYLDQVIDVHGNTMALSYTHDQGQAYLSSILYTGHTGGLAPANRVDLTLENRPDVTTSYRAGFPITIAKRLASIETSATVDSSLELAKRYDLTYTQSTRTDRSLLTSVTQFGSDGVLSMPPMTFTYQDDDAPTYSVMQEAGSGGEVAWNVRVATYDCGHDNYGYVHPYNLPNPLCGYPSYGSTVVVGGGETKNVSGFNVTVGSNGSIQVPGGQDRQIHAWTAVYMDPARPDKRVSFSAWGSWDVASLWVESKSGFSGPYSAGNLSNIPFEGGWSLLHIVGYNQNQGFSMGLNTAVATSFDAMSPSIFSDPQLTGDVNGDAVTDLIDFDDGTWSVTIATEGSTLPDGEWLTGFGDNTHQPLLGDWNADGLTDVATYKNGAWRFATSDGSQFVVDGVPAITFGGGSPWTGDFNGDGVTDLATYEAGQVTVALGSGSGFSTASSFDMDFAVGGLPSSQVAWNVGVRAANCFPEIPPPIVILPTPQPCLDPSDPPSCSSLPSFTEVNVGTTSVGGRPITVQSNGGVLLDGAHNYYIYANTWVYLENATSSPKSFSQWGNWGGGWAGSCMYVQPDGGSLVQVNPSSVNFGAGWTRIHYVGYCEWDNFDLGTTSAVASMFDVMSPQKLDIVDHSKRLTGDFNGDGLTDIALIAAGDLHVAYSKGDSFVLETPWPIGFGDGEYLAADFNGDGLTDISHFNRVSGKIQVGYSTGAGFQSPVDLPPTFTLTSEGNKVQLGEFNGDGLPDVAIFNSITGDSEMALSSGTGADLLNGTDNGIGSIATITYQPTTVLNNDFLPFVMRVVTESSISDGMGNSYTTTYNYENGSYDAAAQEFRGFGRVEVTDALGTRSVTEFHQDALKKGRVMTTELRDAQSNLWTRSARTWSVFDPHPGYDTHFIRLDQTDSYVYDGDATFNHVRGRFDYDAYGNITAKYRDGDASVTGDERIALTTFSLNTTDWILDKFSSVQTLDASSNIVSHSRFFYDGATSTSTTPTRGDQTKREDWLNLPSAQWLPTTYAYDAYGNLISTLNARGFTSSNRMDTATQTFIVETTGPLGHTTTTERDPRTGRQLTITEANGVTSYTSYDALGRAVELGVLNPTNGQSIVMEERSYDLSTVPTRTISTTYAKEGRTEPTVNYIFADGLGRTIQKRSPAEAVGKQVVSGAVEFDSKGRVAKQWSSYIDDTSTTYVPHTSVAGLVNPEEYTYDPMGRIVHTLYSDAASSSESYDDWAATSTDANGHVVRRTRDAHGNLVRIEEFNGGDVYTTTYQYDAVSRLVHITDAATNHTSIVYDSLGRRLSMDHPDRGLVSYTYDDSGNILTQTDARGITISYQSDGLNRVTQKSYSNGDPSVTYTYDDISLPYSIGRLKRVSDGSGTVVMEHDFHGRVTRETYTLDGTPYVSSRTYDLYGRMLTSVYPSGDSLLYTYNVQGHLESLTLSSQVHGQKTILSDVDYNAAAQLTKVAYGNGVVSDYIYDPETLRLDRLVSQGTAGTLQDLSYSFDDVGNIVGITDAINTGSQTLTYDDLNRLVSASGASYGTRTYGYDAIGNMTNKAGVAMSYGEGAAGPHAVTSTADGKVISYDATGNMISKASGSSPARTFTYDAEDRMTESEGALTLQLPEGWNLVGFPNATDNMPVSQAYSNFNQSCSQISRQDAASGKFESIASNGGEQQFTNVSPFRGYWVNVTNSSAATISMTGSVVAATAQPLSAGWNALAGPPRSMSTGEWLNNLVAGTDYGQVLAYDNASGSMQPVTTVLPGHGYLVEMLRAVSWTPPATSGDMKLMTRFVYNGDGGRVKEIGANGTTLFLGDSYEIAPGGETTENIFIGSLRVATFTSSGELQFYHNDHLGSANVISDDAGVVVELTEYTPYGSVSRDDGSANSPYKFTGQRLDSELGLYYYNARYYDPDLGRFISADDIIPDTYNPQALNSYSYALNNPLKFTDPSGNFAFFAALATFFSTVGQVAGVVALVTSVIGYIGLLAGNTKLAARMLSISQIAGYVALGANIASGVFSKLDKIVNPVEKVAEAIEGEVWFSPEDTGLTDTSALQADPDQQVINKLLDEGRVQDAIDYAREQVGINDPSWKTIYAPDHPNFFDAPFEEIHHSAFSLGNNEAYFRNTIYWREPSALKSVIFHEYQHQLQWINKEHILFGHRHNIANSGLMEVKACLGQLDNAQKLGLTPKVTQDVLKYMKRNMGGRFMTKEVENRANFYLQKYAAP